MQLLQLLLLLLSCHDLVVARQKSVVVDEMLAVERGRRRHKLRVKSLIGQFELLLLELLHVQVMLSMHLLLLHLMVHMSTGILVLHGDRPLLVLQPKVGHTVGEVGVKGIARLGIHGGKNRSPRPVHELLLLLHNQLHPLLLSLSIHILQYILLPEAPVSGHGHICIVVRISV